MKSALFKEISYPLPAVMDAIDMGVIGLPEIQRPFVWKNTQVRDLFDSMYKGFPVGFLLFWANGASTGHKQIGIETKQKVPNLLIVDGQQRLTSLYAVVRSREVVTQDYTKQRIEIAFRPRDGQFEVTDAAVRKDPEFIASISDMWSKYTGSYGFITEYLNRLRSYRALTTQEEQLIPSAIERLWDVRNYTFSALELSSDITEEQVAEVFVRINSKGVKLNQADFILTLMSVFWDEGRQALEAFSRQARIPSIGVPSPFNYFLHPEPDELLRVAVGVGHRRARLHHVYSLLRGKDLETEEFSDERRVQQFEILKTAQGQVLHLQNWHEFLKALMTAGFRSAETITSHNSILYAYAMFLIGRIDYKVDAYELRALIARWFFFTSLTSRYSSSPETQMEADFLKIRNLKTAAEFTEALDQIMSDTLTEDYWKITLPNELATSSARSPSLYAYYASLCLLNARVLFSQLSVYDLLDPMVNAYKKATERHHLFPKKHLHGLGITEKADVNQIANFALLEWHDNIAISDRAPNEYFPKYVQRCIQHGEESELANMRFWHALPEGWEQMAYKNFLGARRQCMAEVIRAGFARLAAGQGVAESTVAAAMSAASMKAAASPNKHRAKTAILSSSGDYRQLQLRFWTTFKTYLESNTSMKCGDPWPRHYMRVKVGIPHARLSAVASVWDIETDKQDPELRAVMTLWGESEGWRYAALLEKQHEIESALGFPLIWRQTEGKNVFRILVRKHANFLDEKEWPDLQGWLKDHLEALYRVLVPALQKTDPKQDESAAAHV
jgi:hypothetical protein